MKLHLYVLLPPHAAKSDFGGALVVEIQTLAYEFDAALCGNLGDGNSLVFSGILWLLIRVAKAFSGGLFMALLGVWSRAGQAYLGSKRAKLDVEK